MSEPIICTTYERAEMVLSHAWTSLQEDDGEHAGDLKVIEEMLSRLAADRIQGKATGLSPIFFPLCNEDLEVIREVQSVLNSDQEGLPTDMSFILFTLRCAEADLQGMFQRERNPEDADLQVARQTLADLARAIDMLDDHKEDPDASE